MTKAHAIYGYTIRTAVPGAIISDPTRTGEAPVLPGFLF